MTLLNPWALLGLGALALPLVIHLLSRTQAVVQRFPSLRFLDVSRLVPTRSPRITDVPLLLVRLGVFTAAVLALASPRLGNADDAQSGARTLARVVIVDTSRSALAALGAERATTAIDTLRSRAAGLAASARASTIVLTAHPRASIAGATSWLAGQGMVGDVVVLSDFQASSVDSADLASIPREFGVQLVRTSGAAQRVLTADSANSAMLTAVRATFDSSATTADWVPRDVNAAATVSLTVLAAPSDQALVDALRAGAARVAAPPVADTARHVTLVLAGVADASTLTTGAQAPSVAWMADILEHLAQSAPLAQAMHDVSGLRDTVIAAPFATVLRNDAGVPVLYAAQAMRGTVKSLMLVSRLAVATPATVTLLAEVQQAIGTPWRISESDPVVLTDSALRALQRAPGTARTASAHRDDVTTADESSARWFWVLALLLLGLEAAMRGRVATRTAARDAARDAMLEAAR